MGIEQLQLFKREDIPDVDHDAYKDDQSNFKVIVSSQGARGEIFFVFTDPQLVELEVRNW